MCFVLKVDVGLDESFLRRRIQELQHYRRMGLRTVADVDKFEQDVIRRVRLPLVLSLQNI